MLEQEQPLEIRKELAKEVHRETVEEFGLEESPIFVEKFAKMRGLDHGPNHREGDPAEHTELFELELKDYLRTQEHGLAEDDVETLRLAAVLHDIGKADSQKYDVASDAQRGKIDLPAGLSMDEEVKRAEALKIETAEALETDENYVTDLKRMRDGVDAREDLNDKQKKKEKEKLEQRLKKERVARSLAGKAAEYPAIVANFQGHEKSDLVGPLIDGIVSEMGRDFTDERKETLRFLIENHMLPLRTEDMNLKNFKERFVSPDGGVDGRRIVMLRALGHADNAATINKGQISSAEFLARYDGKMDALKKEFADERERERARQERAALEERMFGGSLGKFVTKDLKIPGRQVGEVKEAIGALLTAAFVDDPGLTPEAFRAMMMKADLPENIREMVRAALESSGT